MTILDTVYLYQTMVTLLWLVHRLKSSRGAVYVFTRTTGTSIWTQRDKILSNDLSTGDKFGNSIAISPNSLKAIIGASGGNTK